MKKLKKDDDVFYYDVEDNTIKNGKFSRYLNYGDTDCDIELKVLRTAEETQSIIDHIEGLKNKITNYSFKEHKDEFKSCMNLRTEMGTRNNAPKKVTKELMEEFKEDLIDTIKYFIGDYEARLESDHKEYYTYTKEVSNDKKELRIRKVNEFKSSVVALENKINQFHDLIENLN